jgi:peptide/nickel transport system permease protein
MFLYIVRRLLIFIPTLLVISLITFAISQAAPGDPVADMISGLRAGESGNINYGGGEKAYLVKRHELGLDLPVFYFSINTSAVPDTLHRIQREDQRAALRRLIGRHGNWPEIEAFHVSIRRLQRAAYDIGVDSVNADALIVIKDATAQLLVSDDDERIQYWMNVVAARVQGTPSLYSMAPLVSDATQKYAAVLSQESRWRNLVPSLKFFGANNQYHRWFFGGQGHGGFIRGDFGMSYQTHRPVADEIWEAVGITLRLSLLAILITYIIGVPIGVWTAVRKGSLFDHTVTAILFSFYSLPAFWVGVLFIIWFGGGDFLNWFPPAGLGDVHDLPADASWATKLMFRAWHLVLPLIVLVYPTLAFLSRQARGGILNVLGQDYIRTAWAKGLPQNKVVWKHAFRNALLPVLTLFANVFPYAIAGSVVVEVVFSIPGMGRLTLDAIYARNFPIVYTVVMLSAVMTMIGYLVVDVLYAAVDPRITYKSRRR